MKDNERKFDLENRLVDFADMVIDVVEQLPNGKAANHLGGQLVRSGTAPGAALWRGASSRIERRFCSQSQNHFERTAGDADLPQNHPQKEFCRDGLDGESAERKRRTRGHLHRKCKNRFSKP